jgi:hypothetical protein
LRRNVVSLTKSKIQTSFGRKFPSRRIPTPKPLPAFGIAEYLRILAGVRKEFAMTSRQRPKSQGDYPLHTVFLCGPITGFSQAASRNWRQKVTLALEKEACVIDPTRDFLTSKRHSEDVAGRSLTAERLLHGKRTVARNRFDIRRADVVLACFLGSESVSIGAVGEIFWADALSKPIVIVREENNIHNHDMLNELAGWIFEDLGTAVNQVKRLVRIL